jgi:hypothetical protein
MGELFRTLPMKRRPEKRNFLEVATGLGYSHLEEIYLKRQVFSEKINYCRSHD